MSNKQTNKDNSNLFPVQLDDLERKRMGPAAEPKLSRQTADKEWVIKKKLFCFCVYASCERIALYIKGMDEEEEARERRTTSGRQQPALGLRGLSSGGPHEVRSRIDELLHESLSLRLDEDALSLEADVAGLGDAGLRGQSGQLLLLPHLILPVRHHHLQPLHEVTRNDLHLAKAMQTSVRFV